MARCRWMDNIVWSILALSLLVSGCAAVDRRVDIPYQPTAKAVGGSGELYLAQEAGQSVPGSTSSVQWIVGAISNNDGEKTGNVVTDIAPADLVMNAFAAEFKAAGYTVVPVRALPAGVARGLRLTSASIRLDDVVSIFKDEAKSVVKISVEPWKNGGKVNRFDYESVYAETAVTDRDQVLPQTLQKSLQTLMERSVPELIRIIEQK
jgi:hypothetical protein